MKKILILASNPRKDLSLDREIRELKDVIERSRSREEFEVEEALAVRVGDLQELLFQHEPQIVHFCGHGGGQTGLVLEGDDGGEQWVQTEALSSLFRLFSSKVRCVLLNACYSEEQASEIVNHIDHVIGMEQEIRDDAAIAFSKGFYRALGYDCSIEEAYEFGCNAIQLEITNRSTVRSASTELTRKAEVVKAVATTVIPEHMKPILKKREGAFRAEEWENNAMPFLSQEKKEAIQLELVQEVINTSPDKGLLIQTRMNSSTPASQSPQGLLGAPVSRRRRIAPLIIGSMVAGLLPVIGIYSYIKLANQPESTASTQAGMFPREKPPAPIVPALPIDPPLPKPTRLNQAMELATRKQWEKAIALLNESPADSSDAEQSQFYLEKWSVLLLKSATDYYNDGNMNDALKQAQAIPENSPNYTEAQKAIADWKEDQQKMDKLKNVFLSVHDMEDARSLLPEIHSPGLRKQAEELTEKTQKIVDADKARVGATTTVIPPVKPPVLPEPSNNQYLWLAERPAISDDLDNKTALELDIMRNSIYARHGLIFKLAQLQPAFSEQPWYEGTDDKLENIQLKLNEQELKNDDFICNFQKKEHRSTTPTCSN